MSKSSCCKSLGSFKEPSFRPWNGAQSASTLCSCGDYASASESTVSNGDESYYEDPRVRAVAPTTDEEVSEFMQEISMDDCVGAGWALCARKSGCDVWSMQSKEAGTVKVKIDGSASFTDVPLDVLLEVVTGPEHMTKWDKNMLEFRVAYDVDDRTRVNYYSVSMPMPLKNRDWVLRQSVVLPDNGTPPAKRECVIFNKSCTSSDLPVRPEFVRANCILNGWYLAPTDDGRGCRVHYYAHNEFLGSIPTSLINWATKVFSAGVLGKLRQACDVLMKQHAIAQQRALQTEN